MTQRCHLIDRAPDCTHRSLTATWVAAVLVAAIGTGVTEAQAIPDAGSLRRESKNLDSADKFTLGGARGVRAYPPLEANPATGKDSDGSAQILRLWVGLAAYF